MAKVTLDQIKIIIGLQLGIKVVKENDRLVEEFGAESADLVNIIANVEERYSIHIKESEFSRIATAADLYSLVLSHLSEID